MNQNPITLQAAADAVVARFPGASSAGGGKLIRLPISGVTLELRTGPAWGRPGPTEGTMHLRLRGRDRVWCNVPSLVRLEPWAFRTSREIRRMLLELRDEAPAQRVRNEAGKLTAHLTVCLSPGELQAANEMAKARGMSISGFIRRGISLARLEIVEGWEDLDAEHERLARSALRLLYSGKPMPDVDDPAVAEAGGGLDLMKATRVAIRNRVVEPNPDWRGRRVAQVAEALGIGWLFGGFHGRDIPCTRCGAGKVWVPAGDSDDPALCPRCCDEEAPTR